MEKSRTCSVRWERQLGASQLNYSLRWKSLLCCFNDHLAEKGKNTSQPPTKPTIDTLTEKLVDEANTRKIHYVDCAANNTQFMNNPVKANKLCQSHLTGKLGVWVINALKWSDNFPQCIHIRGSEFVNGSSLSASRSPASVDGDGLLVWYSGVNKLPRPWCYAIYPSHCPRWGKCVCAVLRFFRESVLVVSLGECGSSFFFWVLTSQVGKRYFTLREEHKRRKEVHIFFCVRMMKDKGAEKSKWCWFGIEAESCMELHRAKWSVFEISKLQLKLSSNTILDYCG